MPPVVHDTLYWDIKLGAGAAVVALDLPGIGDRVYGQLIPGPTSGYHFGAKSVKDLVYPCVVLTSEGETEELKGGESEYFVGVFPQRCWILDMVDANAHGKERVYLTARRTLIKAFHQQRLAGVPAVRSVFVQPEVMIDPRLPQYQTVMSGMVLRFEWGQSRYPS